MLFYPGFRSGLCRPQDSQTGSQPRITENELACILLTLYLLFVPVEILEVLVVMEGHVADGMALALLVGGVHNRVGGVREVNQVAAVLQRFHNL